MPPDNVHEPVSADSSADAAFDAIERFRSHYAAVRRQIQRVIVGHDEVVDGVLTCLFCDGHALLEGVPGLGKTLLIRTLAKSLRLDFSRVQFTPDLMPADISGTTVVMELERAGVGGGASRSFVFQKGPVFAQIVLADEINRATPKTQSALLEAMQERSVTVGGVTHALPRPFLVMATQNPIEQEGTYPLPEAQLDRFFFKLLVASVNRRELTEILDRTTAGKDAEVEPVLNGEQIVTYQRLVQRAVIAPPVQDYAVRVVLATHPRSRIRDGDAHESFSTPLVDRYVRLGASPRAAQSIVLAAKCRAMLDGRAAASIVDIQQVALPALRHRLILNYEAQAEGVSADSIVENILATLPSRLET